MERGRQAKAFRRAAAGAPALAGRQDRIPHAQGGPATRVRAAPEPAIIAELQRIIDASVVASITGGMTFLVTEYGKPFTSSGFGNKLRAWCEEAELYGLSAHRVRKAAATRAAENGATAHQLMTMFSGG